jgi:hypothetical protein
VAATERIGNAAPGRAARRVDQPRGIGVDPPRRVARGDDRNAFRLLALRPREIGVAVQAEDGGELFIGPSRQQRQLPAEQRRGHSQRADGMAGVVLAVTERALPVLPRLTPVDGRESDKEARAERCPGGRFQHRPLFEPVLARGVVADATVANDVGLGWMEVAARRVDAQRPPRLAILLPR